MLQPDTIQTLNDSVKVLPDSLARLDSLAVADSIHRADSLRAVALIPKGFIGIPHPSLPQTESWVFAVLFILFFVLVYAISQSSGFITETVKTFFQVKERSSIFSKATVNDFRFKFFINIFSIGVLSLYAYLILFKGNDQFEIKEYGYFFGLICLFLMLKLFVFNVLGYVFLTPLSLKMAKDSYFNVISFLGVVLYPLMILQIYIPNSYYRIIEIMSLIACIVACILVIIKLFQIFFQKTVASFYILLYLCTLEILPLIALYQVCKFVI
jgi:hypothetical protein